MLRERLAEDADPARERRVREDLDDGADPGAAAAEAPDPDATAATDAATSLAATATDTLTKATSRINYSKKI